MTVFLPQEVIRAKRDGGALAPNDIRAFISGLTSGTVGEGQAAAFAMAVLWRGMSSLERVALTEAMRDSGTVLTWPSDSRPVVDKHSTGGIGDTTSLLLAPILAAAGARVPMISGRGLGHTGGTLDKMDAIPGYQTAVDLETFQRVVGNVGCVIIGQTDDLAPADRRLYGIRDVTATVESLDLIVASILSKKLAAGLDVLTMDVKVGNGAFMTTLEDAQALAQALIDVGTGAGMKTTAVLTDMSQPLADAAGNAVEVAEAIKALTGAAADGRLLDATVALCGDALASCGLADDAAAGEATARRLVESGAAAEKFSEMVAALGGPADILTFQRHLPQAQVVKPVFADQTGYVTEINARAIGLAVIALGGGRTRPQDPIDHNVGFTGLARIGAAVGPDAAPLGWVHAADADAADRAAAALHAAYHTGDAAPTLSPLILLCL